MNTYNKKLYKSKENKVIFGVIGGIGEYFDVDPVLLRVVYIIIDVLTGIFPGIIAYLIMAMIIPQKPDVFEEKAKDAV